MCKTRRKAGNTEKTDKAGMTGKKAGKTKGRQVKTEKQIALEQEILEFRNDSYVYVIRTKIRLRAHKKKKKNRTGTPTSGKLPWNLDFISGK